MAQQRAGIQPVQPSAPVSRGQDYLLRAVGPGECALRGRRAPLPQLLQPGGPLHQGHEQVGASGRSCETVPGECARFARRQNRNNLTFSVASVGISVLNCLIPRLFFEERVRTHAHDYMQFRDPGSIAAVQARFV